MSGKLARNFEVCYGTDSLADHFTVECDLPGLDQKDIDLSIASGVLTIKGEKKGEKVNEKAKVYRKGLSGLYVSQTQIELPKKEEAKTRCRTGTSCCGWRCRGCPARTWTSTWMPRSYASPGGEPCPAASSTAEGPAGVLNLTLHRKEAIKPRKFSVRS